MLRKKQLLPTIALVLSSLACGTAAAHGSVTPDADLCIIQIGYFRAHFKIYQPETRGQQDYCEDLPDDGRTVFIMEYEHSDLSKVPIDFRVVRNVTGNGQFANSDDINAIDDLDAITVFRHEPAVQRDVFMAEHEFEDKGAYIGIVTVRNPDTQKLYTAVFPFEVGYWGVGYWPLIVLVALLLQLHYLWMNGWFRRRPKKPELKLVTSTVGAIVLIASILVSTSVEANDDGPWQSRSGHYSASFDSELQPLTINRIHYWVVTIVDSDNNPVSGASIEVSGGMPAHNHGMPTDPRMTQELGDGRYRVDGMRFHMRGEWIIELLIESNGVRDSVRIPLTL